MPPRQHAHPLTYYSLPKPPSETFFTVLALKTQALWAKPRTSWVLSNSWVFGSSWRQCTLFLLGNVDFTGISTVLLADVAAHQDANVLIPMLVHHVQIHNLLVTTPTLSDCFSHLSCFPPRTPDDSRDHTV